MSELESYQKNARKPMNLPKANVVRVSILTPQERQRYLGIIDAAIDTNIKSPIYRSIYADEPVFYGILQSNDSLGVTLTPNWSENGGPSGTIGGMLRDLGSSTKVGQAIGAAGDIMHALTGISGSTTGSSTMAAFTGVALSDFRVTCAWYLPEQYSFCTHSLRNISRMAYPVQVPEGSLGDKLKSAVNHVSNAFSGAPPESADPNDASLFVDGINKAVDFGAGAVEFGNDLLGRNLTLDPIPVRCSIGHYLDLEPLVINNLSIKFSPDTFLHESGLHLPITCTVEIGFKFWMVPAPKLEFMKLLGNEMFGEGIPYGKAKELYDAMKEVNKARDDRGDNLTVEEHNAKRAAAMKGGR